MTAPPPTAGAAERRLDALAAARLDLVPVPVADLWDADRCPARWLPILAAGLDMPWWSADWDEAQQRLAIGTAIDQIRRLGTRAGVEDGLRANGVAFAYARTDAYQFRVVVSVDGATTTVADVPRLRRAIDTAKRAAAHYTLAVTLGAPAGLILAMPAAAVRVAPLLRT